MKKNAIQMSNVERASAGANKRATDARGGAAANPTGISVAGNSAAAG